MQNELLPPLRRILLALGCDVCADYGVVGVMNPFVATERDNFAVDLASNTRTHKEWLAVVQFGLGTLLENQSVLAEILVAEAMRESKKNPTHQASDEIAKILNELGLRFCVSD